MISFYVSPPNIGLKFGTPTERDIFWARIAKSELNGFNASLGAERIGNRTIRFYPAKMKQGFEWGLNGAAPAKQVAPPEPAPAPVLPPAATQDFVTTNPFASAAPNAKPALPGLSPSPPPEMLAKTQPVVVATPVAVAVQTAGDAAIEKMLAVSAAEETKPDPEPKDKRTRAHRDWKARQKA